MRKYGMCIEEQLDKILLGPPPRSYSCLMANLPAILAKEITEYASQIDVDHLDEEGISDPIHLTVKYGIHSDKPDAIKPIIAGHPPLQFTLGAMSVFPADEKRPSDVLKIGVTGPQLYALNAKITNSTPCTTTYDYSPHVTVAYLKPGLANRYLSDQFNGREVIIPELVFSSKDRTVSMLKLGR